MPLIECRELRKDFSGTGLFSGVSFSVEPGRKTALIGQNGAGKTTLLRIIAGLDDDFGGRVIRSADLRFAYVPQRFEPDPGLTALDILLEDVFGLRKALADLEDSMGRAGKAEMEAVLDRYGKLREEYEKTGGDDAEDSAVRLLSRAGLGGCENRPAAGLSGGEANVLGLLKALMSRPNFLALDEPGNHLDLWGQAWLEEFLKGLPIALLLVSHNRWLIDRVAGSVLSLEGGSLAAYSGGYSAYRLERLGKAAAAGAGWQADRKKVERLEALVKRFAEIAASRPDPAWGKRLRARRSQLEREKAQARDRPDLGEKRMALRFSENDARSTYALAVNGYRKAFGDRTLFDGAGFDILTGEKVALVGRNGCGKTSFIRDLIARGDWSDDVLRLAPSMRVGYVSQAQDTLPGDKRLREAFEALGARPDEIRQLLKRFLFENADLERRIGELSGGELNRLQLARAVWLKANFLILDEPTNHLDIASREVVEEALNEFDGTILLVSHDRFLLESVADRVILADEGKFLPYEGNFSEFWRDTGLSGMRKISADTGIEGRAAALSEKNGRKADIGGDLALRIETMERERENLEKEAKKAVETRDFAAGRKISAEIGNLARRIEELYARWLE